MQEDPVPAQPPPVPHDAPVRLTLPAPELLQALYAITLADAGLPPQAPVLLSSSGSAATILPGHPAALREDRPPIRVPATGQTLQALRIPSAPLRHILAAMTAPDISLMVDPAAPYRLLLSFQEPHGTLVRHLLLLPPQPRRPA